MIEGQDATDPAELIQLALVAHLDDRRLDDAARTTELTDLVGERRALAVLPLDANEHRIPLRVPWSIDQHRPHGRGRRLDDEFRMNDLVPKPRQRPDSRPEEHRDGQDPLARCSHYHCPFVLSSSHGAAQVIVVAGRHTA